MSVKDDGGFAYPQTPAVGPSGDLYHPCQQGWGGGMSLRDYFAAMQMSRIGMGWPNEENMQRIAANCYAMADAMLAERSK